MAGSIDVVGRAVEWLGPWRDPSGDETEGGGHPSGRSAAARRRLRDPVPGKGADLAAAPQIWRDCGKIGAHCHR